MTSRRVPWRCRKSLKQLFFHSPTNRDGGVVKNYAICHCYCLPERRWRIVQQWKPIVIDRRLHLGSCKVCCPSVYASLGIVIYLVNVRLIKCEVLILSLFGLLMYYLICVMEINGLRSNLVIEALDLWEELLVCDDHVIL